MYRESQSQYTWMIGTSNLYEGTSYTIADFSDWIVKDEEREQEVCTGLTLMTVQDRESLYTRKEVCKALEAAEFLQSLRYPTEHEAIKLVQSGNIRNIPYSMDDVRHFYDIYGAQIPGLQGRTTKRHTRMRAMDDSTAKLQITH
jgi:hypothetical protein